MTLPRSAMAVHTAAGADAAARDRAAETAAAPDMLARQQALEGSGEYDRLRDIGSGSFGFVQAARHRRSGKKVAINFMQRGHSITRLTEREVCTCSILTS